MDHYVTDKEQVQQIREWWNSSGKWLVLAVLVGLLVSAGYRYWKGYQVRRTETASRLYDAVMLASSKQQFGVERQYVAQLQKSYGASIYTSFATLQLSHDQVAANYFKAAVTGYNWVIKHSDVRAIKQVARIRAARSLLAMKQNKQAMAMITTIDDKTFKPVVDNIKGDIYRVEGQSKLAAVAYEQAKRGYSLLGANNPIMMMQMAS